jgi:hypothetical protein
LIDVRLVAPWEVPAPLNGYLVQQGSDMKFVMRDDLTAAQLAAAITRMGALVGPVGDAQR